MNRTNRTPGRGGGLDLHTKKSIKNYTSYQDYGRVKSEENTER